MKAIQLFSGFVLAATLLVSTNTTAQSKTVMAGTADSGNTSEFAAKAKEAGLGTLLSGKGEYTVFAPTNGNFNPGSASGDDLRAMVTYYIVPGKIDTKVIERDIKDGHGRAIYTSLEGGKLWAMKDGGRIVIKDERGKTVSITGADKYMSNGVVHEISGVAMQKN